MADKQKQRWSFRKNKNKKASDKDKDVAKQTSYRSDPDATKQCIESTQPRSSPSTQDTANHRNNEGDIKEERAAKQKNKTKKKKQKKESTMKRFFVKITKGKNKGKSKHAVNGEVEERDDQAAGFNTLTHHNQVAELSKWNHVSQPSLMHNTACTQLTQRTCRTKEYGAGSSGRSSGAADSPGRSSWRSAREDFSGRSSGQQFHCNTQEQEQQYDQQHQQQRIPSRESRRDRYLHDQQYRHPQQRGHEERPTLLGNAETCLVPQNESCSSLYTVAPINLPSSSQRSPEHKMATPKPSNHRSPANKMAEAKPSSSGSGLYEPQDLSRMKEYEEYDRSHVTCADPIRDCKTYDAYPSQCQGQMQIDNPSGNTGRQVTNNHSINYNTRHATSIFDQNQGPYSLNGAESLESVESNSSNFGGHLGQRQPLHTQQSPFISTSSNSTRNSQSNSRDSNKDMVMRNQNSSKSPKIIHYHLTIQNCDGLEIHVDNPEQRLRQKTMYSADGCKLKRLSWIEVPSNPIDVGPQQGNLQNTHMANNMRVIPEKFTQEGSCVSVVSGSAPLISNSSSEDSVFISQEAERLFGHGQGQVIIQETGHVNDGVTQAHVQPPNNILNLPMDGAMQTADADLHHPARLTFVSSDLSSASSIKNKHSHVQTETQNCSSQTEATSTSYQHTRCTQTNVPPSMDYASRARQAAARRRATSPFRRRDIPDITPAFPSYQHARDQSMDTRSGHVGSYNSYNNSVVPHYTPSSEHPRRCRSAERDYHCCQRGLIVEEPSTNCPAHPRQTQLPIDGVTKKESCSNKDKPIGRVAPRIRRSRSLPRSDSSARWNEILASHPRGSEVLEATGRRETYDISSISSLELTPPISRSSSTHHLTPSTPQITSYPPSSQSMESTLPITAMGNVTGNHPRPIRAVDTNSHSIRPMRNGSSEIAHLSQPITSGDASPTIRSMNITPVMRSATRNELPLGPLVGVSPRLQLRMHHHAQPQCLYPSQMIPHAALSFSQPQQGINPLPQRPETITERLARIREDLIRMPGVLILGLRAGKIIVTLSPNRTCIEDIIRFMRIHNVPMHDYECAIVSHRYRQEVPLRESQTVQSPSSRQHNTVMTCLVR